MGSYNYLIIPSLKIKVVTKLSIDGHYPDYNKFKYDKLFNNEDLEYNEYGGIDIPSEETKLKDLGELTIKNATNMFSLCKIAENVANPSNWEEILCYYLDMKEVEFFTIHESDERLSTEFKDFITLE